MRKLTEDQKLIASIFDSYCALQALGWKEPIYAPKDGSEIEVIEAGSTGIHKATRDRDGTFWVYDGESYPVKPMLWRPKA